MSHYLFTNFHKNTGKENVKGLQCQYVGGLSPLWAVQEKNGGAKVSWSENELSNLEDTLDRHPLRTVHNEKSEKLT